MLRNWKEINLILIGLFILYLSIEYTKSLEPHDQCVAGAYCKMVYGDLLRMANDKTYLEEYEKGRHLLRRHFKYVACGVDQIEKNCDATLKNCILDVYNEAVNTLKIPSHLIYGCEVESLPYVLFLCKNLPYWPNTTDIPNDFKTCHHSCSMILKYNQFHLANGKNQNDFPKDWNENIQQQQQLNTMAKHDPYFKHKIPNNAATKSYKDWTIYSYFEANRRDLFGIYTNESDQFCDIPSYVAGIIDELPTKFLCNCKLELMDYTFDDNNIYDSGFYPTENKIIFCDNKHGPPQGSFIIGLRFLIKIVTLKNHDTRLRYLSASSYLCSGHEWSKLRKPIDKKIEISSDELVCPYLTAICSMRFKRYQLANGTSYITNIKIGCCTVPEHILYSGVRSIGKEYLAEHEKNIDIPQVWIDPARSFDRTTIKKSYCPIGHFIDRFDLARVYFHIKTGGDLYVGVMRNIFYCNNFDKNDQKPLDDTLYDYLYWKGDGSAEENEIQETVELGEHNCVNGFFIGGSLQVEYKKFAYSMICSENEKSIGRGWSKSDSTDWVNENVFHTYLPQDKYNFKCPNKYGICGIHSIQNFIHPSDNHSYITLHGPTFKFICCPIPHFLHSRDCGENDLILNVEKTKQYGGCGDSQGVETKCQVIYTIGYEEKKYVKINDEKTLNILKQFGISKHDMLKDMIHTPNREIGQLATHLASNLTFTKILKETRSGPGSSPPISTREPVTIGLIILTLVAAIIPALITAGAPYLKPGKNKPGHGQYEGAGFKKSITMFSKNTTKQTFTVYNGQRTFFYDVILSCGSFKIYSDTNIRYIRPTLQCQAICEMEYIGQYNGNDNLNSSIIKNFTVQGYGLYIDAAPRHGLVSNLNWVHITGGVRTLFENNPSLVLQGNGLNVSPFSSTKDSLWESYNPRITFTASVTFNASHIGYVYRVLGSCGKYKVFTDKFLLVIGHRDELNLTKLPKYRKVPFTETSLPKNF